MDLEGKRFGRGKKNLRCGILIVCFSIFLDNVNVQGHKELGGARDLINQYRLWPYYEFFCKKSLPLSISETHYLRNVVGNTKIRKGEGMELDQLCRNTCTSEKKACFRPFDLDVLSEAFHMREMDPIHLSSSQKGLPTAVPKLENQARDNKKKNRKDKDIDIKGEKQRKHRLHQVKDGSCVENIRIRHHDSHPLHLKNQQDKKRKAETSINPSVHRRLNARQ